MKWRVEILNRTVMKELDKLPKDMRAKLDRIVILHAFRKKTQKTPRGAIQTALSRMKELES
jgi:phage-related protein